jgi:hypothetical protein
MGVKFVKLDPGGRDVINGILDRLGGELDADGESRRSEVPPRGSPEPFTQSPSSRPADSVGASSESLMLSPMPAAASGPTSAAGVTAPLAPASISDAVTVRPPPGPLPTGAVTPAAPARSAESAGGANGGQSAAAESVSRQPAEHPVSEAARADAARSSTGALRERLDHAKRQSGSGASDKAARAGGSGQIAKPAPRPSKAESSAVDAGASAKRGGSRPWLYAAIALLAAGGVYALSNVEAPPSQPTSEAVPPAMPEPTAAPLEPTAAVEPVAAAPVTAEPVVAEPPAADPQAAVATSVAPARLRYVLEVVSNPEGARVIAGAKSVIAPAEIDLGELADPISVRAEKDGYTPSATTVDRLGFMLDEGAMRRRVVLRLHEAPAAKPEPEREARKPRRDRAPKEEHAPEPTPAPTAPAAVAQPAAEPATPPPPVVKVTPAPAVPVPLPLPAAEPKPAPPVEAKPTPAAEPVKAETADPKTPKAIPGQRPIDAAMDCLATGDNACVIKALEGKAKSAQELELLIETYRTMGNATKAEKYMQVYVEKHPGERRASAYRRVLDNRQSGAPAP